MNVSVNRRRRPGDDDSGVENGTLEGLGELTRVTCFVRGGCIKGPTKAARVQGLEGCTRNRAKKIEGVGGIGLMRGEATQRREGKPAPRNR